MNIKIVRTLPHSARFSISESGALLVNATFINDFEQTYIDSLFEYYSTAPDLSQEEAELLVGMHPLLEAMFKHAKSDLPETEVPNLIRIFQALKNHPAVFCDDTELPDREDPIVF